MEKISPEKLKEELKSSDIQIVDVREPYEFEQANIGGVNIPMGEILQRKDEVTQFSTVVFCCKSGKRAAAVAHTFEKKLNHQGTYVLEGGVEAFLNEYE